MTSNAKGDQQLNMRREGVSTLVVIWSLHGRIDAYSLSASQSLNERAMELSIEATYEGGVLKPVAPLPLAEHERVQIVLHSMTSRARQTAGLMGWTGSSELAEQFAVDPELDSPAAQQ